MLNEFRKDLVSGEWVLFATGRAHRPEAAFGPEETTSTATCPFDDLASSGQQLIWQMPDNVDWRVMLIKNKYPAVMSGVCAPDRQVGPFITHGAVGEHDIFIFRDHEKQLNEMSLPELTEVVHAYKRRKLEIVREAAGSCTKYVLIFNNYGVKAGASIVHPHSQIISTPILPPDVSRSLYGSYRFHKENNQRVYDVLIDWERREQKRVIFENEFFVAFCPFVSRSPYEIRIFPKESHAHFSQMPDSLDASFAEALGVVLRKLKIALDDPAYNFFIHSSPVDSSLGVSHEFYCWHLEIIPKISISAGFEMGTGIEINVADPDEAADKFKRANE